ncbi:hypothetical protein Fmac_009023 [Flemingia macrophylla]|uniref:TIR domain-containing protein n=1 Tax=Flemingia macrophylla TaxID=520843 RepID=A0ABD1MZ38_9FABA
MRKSNILYYFGSCLFLCASFFFASRLFRKLKGGEADENEKPVSELESDNNTPSQVKYDVFVSFRGDDVRDNFLSHLIEAFDMKKINAFVDDKLERGEEISSSFVAAIEGSSISLIIFSPDYASSLWCLKELVTILECSQKYGLIVIPVFYHVQPTHVRHQSESYKNAFIQHSKKHKKEVQLWKDAFTKSADLSGIQSSEFRNEAEMVKEIVNRVMKILAKHPVNSKGLVGIEKRITSVESLIRKEPKDTRLVGIWGIGGIGKTTLAEEIFNKLQSEYEASCFLANEREESKKQGIISLKEKFFSRLLRCDVKIETPNSLPEYIVRRIGKTKVLIVLDDVDDFDHPEKILGTVDNFGPGSRILVTTRDKQVLNKANEIYWLEKLSSDEALDLFISKAFNHGVHQRVDNMLIESVVNYARGIPLVVKVLAGLLCGKSNEEWESLLHKLNTMPCKEIYDVLKLSFDSLELKEQEVFLDLACFFLRRLQSVDVGKLKSLLKVDESDCSMAFELGRLKDKTLITISGDNIVSMHDTLQEMAWKIARDQSIKEDSRHRIRLWDSDDVWKALQNGKVEAIRSIQIDLEKIRETELVADQFAKMSELKFLHIESGDLRQHDLRQRAQWFRSLKSELRFLSWQDYPLKYLPENFPTEELVILKLKGCTMEKIWDGVKNLVSLKEVDFSYSLLLIELPDFSKATNLEVLILEDCERLTTVHPSIFSLPKLEILNLNYCRALTICASHLHLLFQSKTMIELRLSNTHVKELPSLSEHHSKLKSLDLSGSDIECLPSTFSNLKELVHLKIRLCGHLGRISYLPPSLEILDARGCRSLQSICKLPHCLKSLNVTHCSLLKALPELPPSLITLDASECSVLEALPEIPFSLKTLDVGCCSSLKALPELPQPLKILYVIGCSSLKALPELPPSLKTLEVGGSSSFGDEHISLSLRTLGIRGCYSLQASGTIFPSLEILDVRGYSSLEALLQLCPSLETLDVQGCSSLGALPELPSSFKKLDATYCSSLEALPELRPPLKTLDVKGCSSLKALPELPLSLKTLDVRGCFSLKALPKLLPSLETLDVSECYSLESLPELPMSLETLRATCCHSLKIVLFPSTMAEQLKENKKRVWFNGCLNLDEHSVKAIELNAQMNMINKMKFAQNNDRVMYVYPGSSVPEWLKYKTTKDYIIIDDLSSPLLGFIFCFIFHEFPEVGRQYHIEVAISDGEDEGKKDIITITDIWLPSDISDHVYLTYNKQGSDLLISRAKDLARFQLHVLVFKGESLLELIENQDILKGFGLSPISTYDNLVQQMELP